MVLLSTHVATAAAGEDCSSRPLMLADRDASYDLARCVWFLEDPDQSLSLRDIRDEQRHPFTLHEGSLLNFGYTESAYWVRYDVRRGTTTETDEWVLELALPLVDEVQLYVVQGGVVVERQQAGYALSLKERVLAVPNPTFVLTLEPDVETRLYLRVVNTNTFRLPITLWQPASYLEKVAVEEAFRGILLGSIIGILAYNLFVAVSVRERSNIYYVLYLLVAVAFIMTEQVHGLQLFGERPWFLDKQYLHQQIITTWFFGLLMARALLETHKRSPDLDHVIRICLYSVLSTFALSFFVPYHTGMQWAVLVSIVLSVVMIVVSFLSWRHYNPAAKSYFYAWTVALTGFCIYALTVMGFLPLNIFTAHSSQIGLAGQIILFSFSLADRIKLVQGEALNWNQRALANLRQYRSLFDNAVEGVFQMSVARRFVTANPAMAALLGYTGSGQLLATNPDVLDTCFVDDEVRQWVVGKLEATGAIKGVEARYITRQGEERWATISLHTVYDDYGEPTYLEGTCIDATERHHRQQIEKEREQERLEKELARNSAEAKSQFLANMSHEIRTPLAAIIGYGETLLDPDLSEQEKRNSAETVVRSGHHLLELVNDILDHSKIDANKLAVDVVTVNLAELLDELRAFFEPRAQEKGLEFNITCEYPLPETIHTDPTRFRQIIINLCGNALKFTEKGVISLTVRCDREAQRLYVRVVDSGIGMKPEQMQRLFDPFAQGSAAISRQYGGTGLGLSISRRLAELLGGSITADSTYGEGSDFEVNIATGPLDGVHFLRNSSELTQRRQLPLVLAPRLSGRVLCAEDNEVNRKLVSLLLERTGVELVHVGNGAEVLETALNEPFDLILMDIQMPVMNGRDATVALREAGLNTPVIALTANVMAEDIDDYRQAGFSEHLAKPIDKRRFYELLSRYLKTAPDNGNHHNRSYRGLVLVAEDNRDNRALVERLLTRLGLDVMSVPAGDEAVRTALAKPVDLVLMDRHMPGMDGVEATRLMRQAGFRRPIIAFSAGDQREIDDMVGAGCEGVLTKPIDQSRLVAVLDRYLPTGPRPVADAEASAAGIRELAAQFLAGLGERKVAMDAALACRDRQGLQRESHQIKGTAGAMGYPAMTSQAGALEQGLKAEPVDWDQVARQLAVLNGMIEQAVNSGTAQA
ncbi:response regulator [Marinobacter mobilis]|nr:response regulator [Marinobacter mobilis]